MAASADLSPASPELVARLRAGLKERYAIERVLGHGGMATVFLARDLRHTRSVAIKVLHPHLATSVGAERFLREIQTTARLQHPHILALYDSGETGGLLYYIMPFVQGESAADRIAREGQLAIEDAVRIGHEVAEGLAYAHSLGVVHRDIKPANILLADGIHAAIADFGLAHVLFSVSNRPLTDAGLTVGSPHYMSPEQIEGKTIDGKADVYSLGCALFEMIVGHPPFKGSTIRSVLMQHLAHDAPSARALRPEVPKRVEAALLRALAKDPGERMDAAQLREMLESAAHTTTVQPRRARSKKQKPRQPVAVGGAMPAGERRQLTVMYCDVVHPTMSEGADPEELRRLLRDFQAVSTSIVRHYDGHVAKYIGDGLLIYFGYPLAHEDDATRAVRAGLELVRAIGRLRGASATDQAHARVAIDTGIVVVGDMDGDQQLESMAVIGQPPKIAAALHAGAQPGTVLISAATRKLVEGYFHFRDCGTKSLEGVANPIAVYEVVGQSAAQSRLDATASMLTPLIGREREVALLTELWERAAEWSGQVVMLSGEAGIGKSRLARAVEDHVARAEADMVWECRCSAYYQNTPLYPFIELLERRILGFGQDHSPEEKLKNVEELVTASGLSLEQAVPLLAALLSIPFDARYALPLLTPELQKQKTMEVLRELFLKRAAHEPLLLVVEDLHWADASSLEMLTALVEQSQAAPILVLLTFRPDFAQPWGSTSNVTHLALNRLGVKQTQEVIREVCGGRMLPAVVLEQILSKTEGVPLFIEEFTKMVLESGTLRDAGESYEVRESLPSLAVPTTLQDSLTARLDRLSAAKPIAQFCSVLGREFQYALLRAVSPLKEERLKSGLDRLVKAGMLFKRGISSETTYVFKHVLIQEAAYNSMLRSTRQKYHQQIASTLEGSAAGKAAARPELLAHHYTEAGIPERAVGWWLQAGQEALKRSANQETAGHLRRGLALVPDLPDARTRAQVEVTLLSVLGPALIAIRGFGDPEVGEIYRRSRELCDSLGDNKQLFSALWGQWVFYLVRGELKTARALAEDLLRLGTEANDSALLVEGHWTLGDTLYWMAELRSSREHLEEAMLLYDSKLHHSHAFLYGQDPGVAALCYASFTLCQLGYLDKGLRRAHDAVALARELGHPFSVGWALGVRTMVRIIRDEPGAALEEADTTIKFCTEQAYPFWQAGATFGRGWALARLGDPAAGIELMHHGIAFWAATGAEVNRPYLLGLVADAYGACGRIKEGLAAAEEGFTIARRTGEMIAEIHLHRSHGDLLLKSGADASEHAEAAFRKSIELARAHDARLAELEATLSLCELQQHQAGADDGLAMLADLYASFTEGLETSFCARARALLTKAPTESQAQTQPR